MCFMTPLRTTSMGRVIFLQFHSLASKNLFKRVSFCYESFMQILGFLAAVLTTVSFVPQVYKIYRTKRAEDVSTPMFVIFSTGVLFWLIYGVSMKSMPLILANAITLVLALMVLFLKWKYREACQKP